MYASFNAKSKKELKEAVAAGRQITVFQPNNIFGVKPPQNGVVSVEGPHFPKPHKWYARATLENGVIVKVS